MGKTRTLASKRRQRKRQKKKKLLNKHQPITEAPRLSSDTLMGWSDALYIDTDDDYFGSPGSPPPTPSDMSSESSPTSPHDHDTAGEENMISQVKQLQEKCKSYEVLLAKKNESENYFKRKLENQKSQMEDVILEAKRKVISVRTFWRDKIFREQSRAGFIIKRAVCKN